MKTQDAQKMIEAIASQLSEHFDAVQIMISFPCDAGDMSGTATQGLSAGRGNWYARQGMANEFVQRERAREIGFAINPPESA